MKQSRNPVKKISYKEDDSDDAFVIRKQPSRQKSNNKNQNSTTKKQRLKKKSDSDEYQPIEVEEQEQYIPDKNKSQSSSDISVDESDKGIMNKKKNIKQRRTQSSNKKNSQSKKQIIEDDDEPLPGFQNEKEGVASSNAYQQGEDFFQEAEAKLPSFIQKNNIKDEEGRCPDDADYDPSTLHIPIQYFQKLSPMFRQYWNAKRKNFDKFILFRFGRWFYSFYNDALLIGKIFGTRVGYWGKDRPEINVYDSQFPMYVRGLLTRGYKICVIEQTEKGELTQKEKGEIANREITYMMSLGTWQDPNEQKYDSKFLMTLILDKAPRNDKGFSFVYGVSLVDATTNEFHIDQFLDDEHSNQLRALLIRTKPVEMIIQSQVNQDIEKMIKNVCNPIIYYYTKELKPLEHIFEQYKVEFLQNQKKQSKSFPQGIHVLNQNIEPDIAVDVNINQGLYDEDIKSSRKNKQQNVDSIQEEKQIMTLSDDYPTLLQELEKQYNFEKDQNEKYQTSQKIPEDFEEESYSYYYATQALYVLQFYLRKLMLNDTVYKRGTFQLIDSSFQQNTNLYLDSQALESLEIFQANLTTKVQDKGSLFYYLNNCGSNFGKRLLKKWLVQPLFQVKKIIERQQSVQDLVNNIEIAEEFTKRISAFPDFERAVAKVFNSLQPQRLKISSFGGESFGQVRLRELSELLQHLVKSASLIKLFQETSKRLNSTRLIRLVRVKQEQRQKPKNQTNTTKLQQDEQEGLFPDITSAIQELEKCLIIKDGIPQPKKGVSMEYDKCLDELQDALNALNDELEHWKKVLHCKDIVYQHARFRYQLEVPDHVVEGNKKPKEFVIASKKKGYQRFYTEKIENLLFQLKVAEENVAKSLVPFIQEYFQKFYSYKHLWYQLVSCLAELDCLCSLAIVSYQMKTSCLPQFVEQENQNQKGDSFSLEGAIHPCLQQQMPNIKWVPNDVKFSKSIDALLLTGPNMSGKSTLLRLTAVSIILAQLGCYVPAKSFTLTPFDRIFCRIGASDRLLEGKSTFFIEMEETKTILQHCSPRSLVIIDELGRGTSTYDGVAIASAVLKHLVTNLGPKTIFATHYHILLDEFALYKNILNTVMKHHYNEDTGEVTFTYKLVEGYADKSFAANVARIAGVPRSVIQRAIEMEKKITKEEEKLSTNRKAIQRFNEVLTKVVGVV